MSRAILRQRAPLAIAAGVVLLALAATAVNVAAPLEQVLRTAPVGDYDPERMVFLYATLPRLAMCLVCGAALGGAGAILQQVLRNPLASPTTLGFDAGARLALVLATLFAPGLLGWGRDLVALCGSAFTATMVFTLTRRQDYAPMPLVLSGLIVSLCCGSLSAVLTLLNDRYLVSLFIWGGGSMAQQGWAEPQKLVLRLLPLALCAGLLVRPLQLLDLGEAGGRALGARVERLRFVAIALSIALSAFVASSVGVIGFLGLVAPALAHLSGARRFGARLSMSALLGAFLLLLTDQLVDAAFGETAAFVPTGAVTALVGAPLMLVLLSRMRRLTRLPAAAAGRRRPGSRSPHNNTLVLMTAVVLALAAVSLVVGRGVDGGWVVVSATDLADALPWRGPRLLATTAAGVMLALAGAILQRLTGNGLAGPEVLGIGSGATLAVAAGLFVNISLGGLGQAGAGIAGAVGVLLVVLLFSARSGFQPERVVLIGIALSALLDAFVGVLSASGDPRAVQLLAWMSGSPAGIGWMAAVWTATLALVLTIVSVFFLRWLEAVLLGSQLARSIGVPLAFAHLAMLATAAVLTAIATPVLGPLSFIGLMAPHAAQALGLHRPLPLLAGAALAGGAMATAADFAARTLFFPWELPTGLLAALIGAPVLLILVSRRQTA